MTSLVTRIGAMDVTHESTDLTVYVEKGDYYGFPNKDRSVLKKYTYAEVLAAVGLVWGPTAITLDKETAHHLVVPSFWKKPSKENRPAYPLELVIHHDVKDAAQLQRLSPTRSDIEQFHRQQAIDAIKSEDGMLVTLEKPITHKQTEDNMRSKIRIRN